MHQPRANIEDLRPSLISNFLYRIDSPQYPRATIEPLERICSEMQILGDSGRLSLPLNVGVLFFTDDPSKLWEEPSWTWFTNLTRLEGGWKKAHSEDQ